MSEQNRFERADSLFEAALRLPPGERRSFLDGECGDDEGLLAHVGKLLSRVEATATQILTANGAQGASGGVHLDLGIEDLSGTSLGRYKILREIGRGGMGVVYEARDEKLERTVAIKVLPAQAIDQRARERFLREARAAATLNHPNIVAIHDAGEARGHSFLVMEFVDGKSLDTEPPASIDEAVSIARSVCDALEHAHSRGLVHRDLKPGNVLVLRDDERLIAKLTDMGIALTCCSARVTQTGAITGTPTYMAPEQALGHELDGRADLYSLGVMLYLWVTGRAPFEGDDALAVVSQHIHAPVVPPRTYRPDMPAGLCSLIEKLLAKSPDSRYATATELRSALQSIGTEPEDPEDVRSIAIEGLARGRMVGRTRQLDQLQGLWKSALESRSHLALISGEPGVGKTRLAREMVATARLDGALVLAGGCYENEATTPYLPFLEAFRRIVRERSDGQLLKLLGDSAPEIARLAPEIDSRLGPFPDRSALSPQEERLRLFDHIARFLDRMSQAKGLLFFVDDLQWADHGSLALLHYLLRQLAAKRILFLGTYREVDLDRGHALSRTLVDWNRERLATRVRLDRLDRAATQRMLANLLGQEQVSPEFVRTLHDETEGNPFFIEEIVKALIAEGDLVREDARWKRQSTGEFQLPQSVKAAIGSRLERIGDSCSEVLRTAAVLGKMFDFAELSSVSSLSEDELLDALDEAAAAQLVVAGRGESFAFTHDKIREVLYEELNPIRRRRLHARIAQGLERLRGEGATVSVEDLAHHFVLSGDFEKGLEYADRAAEAARRVFAWDEALEMLARARECAEALEREDDVQRIDEAIGDASWARGDSTAAAERFERVIAVTRDPKRLNRLRCKVGELYVAAGDRRGLEHVLQALRELDPERHPRDTANAMMIEARYAHIDGKLALAAEQLERAIELAKPVADYDLQVRLYSYLAGSHQHMACYKLSDEAATRCVEIGERESVPNGVLLGCEFLAENCLFRGDLLQAVQFSEKEEALARQVHAGERIAWSQLRAFAVHAMGRIAEAQSLGHTALELCDRSGDRRLALFMKMDLADCALDLGRVDEAYERIQATVDEADESKLLAHRMAGRRVLVSVLLRQERVAEAVRESRVAVDLWSSSGSRGLELMYAPVFARALVRGGLLDEAAQVLDSHAKLAEATHAAFRLAQNLRVRGLLEMGRGRSEDALATTGRAIEMFEARSGVMDLVGTLVERAALHRERGHAAEAEADIERARRELEGTGATLESLGLERPGGS
jgi:predicted ATPase/predicted Ser/Thr protein kinase